MGIVYSTQFLLEQGVSGDVTYVVPAGVVAVLRDFDCVISGIHSPTALDLEVNDVRIASFNVPTSTLDTTLAWRGRQVVLAGQTIGVVCAAVKDFAISGYLLSLP